MRAGSAVAHWSIANGILAYVHHATALWVLVAFGGCLWPLGAYVTEPPNRGCLIMVFNHPQTANHKHKRRKLGCGCALWVGFFFFF